MHITVLSTYPTANPRHGGQHRVANMIDALRTAGHEVHSVGVLGSDSYPPSSNFLPFPGYDALRRYIDNPFLMEDWAIGEWAVKDAAAYRSLSRLIDKKTDALFCEHPWLFAFAKKFRADSRRPKIKLVYESHNVESELKRQIIEAYYGPSYAAECEALVRDAEIEAISSAELISTVSEADARWTKPHTNAPIVIAPNGVPPNRASIHDVVEANPIAGHRKFALYVASGHPPNVFGFYDIFGDGVGCIAPDDRLVVAGAAGQSIRNDERFAKVAGLGRCFVDAGVVPDAQLRGLLQSAHCIFLPMTSGGGTNLKTAEALWSGRPVISTALAMRGFEAYEHAPGVHVCREKSDFLAALRKCMEAPRFEISKEERDSRKPLLWSETLKPMVDAVHERTLSHA